MLRNNLELIVQYPEPTGYRCRGFIGLHLASPAYVVFDGAHQSDQGIANKLGIAFCDELLRYVGTKEHNVPCSGHVAGAGCHALKEITCRKILVRPAANSAPSGGWPLPTAEPTWLQNWPKANWDVVPIMPAGTTPSTYLPLEWQGINASFWTRDPTESLWAVIQRAGLSPEESRIFISYVRKDTTAVADQLFSALTMEGFDVFLDRSSVPGGVQFQERLMQDLVDKAMVVFLNSAGVNQSKWVAEEIATIKTYRLGLLELCFPGVPKRLDIDSDFTRELADKDLESAGPDYAPQAMKLLAEPLKSIVERIKETHGRALHRRRYELIDNFAAALKQAGRKAQVLPDGTFLLPSSGSLNETVVGLTTRLPELGDFCSLHQRGSISKGRLGWLISPSPFFIAQRQAYVSWLGGLCDIQHANEAQITTLAQNL
ncbi:MAG TPA: toll/interleukin-1 receptor domain-containing protein [Pyrinomonadaceae bacterium]|nr:toll/interleukin-1 receptor domain-containing protein [Pyrinomonadaceae bacterium]